MSNYPSNNQQTNQPSQLTQTANIQLTSENIYNSKAAFELALRMSQAFSASTIVPREYQNNPANCLIALEMANRNGMSPLMVMQNLYVINGRPSWSSQFIVAMINRSGKYKSELQYEISGSGENIECYAYAYDHDDRKVTGPVISMKMAKAEGWLDRNMSKWKTMPEVMIRYRAASFFGRLNCPDMIMGIYSEEEVIELPKDSYSQIDANSDPYSDYAASTATNDIASAHGDVLHDPAPAADNAASAIDNGAIIDVDPGERIDAVDTPAPPAEKPGDNGKVANNNGNTLACADCGLVITNTEHTYTKNKYGRPLCRACQAALRKNQ